MVTVAIGRQVLSKLTGLGDNYAVKMLWNASQDGTVYAGWYSNCDAESVGGTSLTIGSQNRHLKN